MSEMPLKELDLGRGTCDELPAAERREWLVTNGIGGYTMGTVAGLLTRCYHGLLVAALDPPLGRTLLVAKLRETARYGEGVYPLLRQLADHGLGSISEIDDGGPPYTSRCCVAQAWSVAELLRA